MSKKVWEWQKLATYNAEVARGLVHTDAWKKAMAIQQAAFNEEQRRENA